MSIRGFWARLVGRAPDPEPRAQPTLLPAVPTAAPAPAQAPARRQPRKILPTYVLADRFVKWMQGQGCTGYWLVNEIDELCEAFCDTYNLEVPGQQEFRSYLAETRGVTRGRYRLKSWEFREVARRTTIEKPILYRIASKAVSETISSDFYADLATGRPMGAHGQCEGAQDRTLAVQTPATRPKKNKKARKSLEIEAGRLAA